MLETATTNADLRQIYANAHGARSDAFAQLFRVLMHKKRASLNSQPLRTNCPATSNEELRTIGRNGRAIDELRIIGRQECHATRDFFRFTQPARRNA